MDRKELDLAEKLLQTLFGQLGPRRFSVALSNAFVHGEIFDECCKDTFDIALDKDDKILGMYYEGIEKFRDAGILLELE